MKNPNDIQFFHSKGDDELWITTNCEGGIKIISKLSKSIQEALEISKKPGVTKEVLVDIRIFGKFHFWSPKPQEEDSQIPPG